MIQSSLLTAAEASRPRRPGRDAWLAAMLVGALLLTYGPALTGEPLLDDDLHITSPQLRSLAGLGRIWSEVGATQQYYPVLHTAFWLEHRLWGDAVVGYHLANVLFHAIAAWLMVALMRELRLAGACLAGFFFALHPLAVESVAWIAEQKNTLSTAFALGAVLAYVRFERSRVRRDYAIASGLFVLALLSKTATATIPAAILVVIWWRRGALHWRRDLAPLMPWLAGSALAVAVTLRVELNLIAGISADLSLTPVERLLIASRALWFYAAHLVWPAGLSFFYERFVVEAANALAWLPLLGAAAVIVGLGWVARRTRGPLAVFLLFAGTLVPVLGFVNVEWFVFAFVADHFQYVANIAVIIAVAAVLGRAPGLGAAGWALVLAGGIMTWRYSATFHDNVSLYANAVTRSPRSAVAHNHYAVALAKIPERRAHAIAEFEAALRINPGAAEVHENLGALLVTDTNTGEKGIGHLEAALQLKPQLGRARRLLADAYFDRAQVAAGQPGRLAEAVTAYEEALRVDPNSAEAHYDLGNALMKLPGRSGDAIVHFESALRLRPDFAEAHTNLGSLLARTPGGLPRAVAHFEAALRAKPDFAPARKNLEAAHALLKTSPAAK